MKPVNPSETSRQVHRRNILKAGGAMTMLSPTAAAAATRSPMRFDDPEWSRDTLARLMGNLDFGREKWGWCRGVAIAVRPGQPNVPFVGVEVVSTARLVDNHDGTYQRLLREVGIYYDLKTGAVLETLDNPFTGETVKVVPIANDPFNFVISQWEPDGPAYGGLNKPSGSARKPISYPWRLVGPDTVVLETDVHLFYPSALQPDKWVRESSGKMNTVSEMFRYFIRSDDVENPALTGLEYTGAWSRITPWFPWMLMDQAPGQMVYSCTMAAFNTIDGLRGVVQPSVLKYIQDNFAKYLSAPKVWTEPSLSSLENYAREQKPAPPRASK